MSEGPTLPLLRMELMPVLRRLPAYSRLAWALVRDRRVKRRARILPLGGSGAPPAPHTRRPPRADWSPAPRSAPGAASPSAPDGHCGDWAVRSSIGDGVKNHG